MEHVMHLLLVYHRLLESGVNETVVNGSTDMITALNSYFHYCSELSITMPMAVRGNNEPSKPIRIKKIHSHLIANFIT
jgi:hypothetical protein